MSCVLMLLASIAIIGWFIFLGSQPRRSNGAGRAAQERRKATYPHDPSFVPAGLLTDARSEHQVVDFMERDGKIGIKA